MNSRRLLAAGAAGLIALAWSHLSVIGAEKPEALIVKCTRPCTGVITTVRALGGETTQIYDNVDAVAVSVPSSRVAELSAAVGAGALTRDVTIALPPSRVVEADAAVSAQALESHALDDFVRVQPTDYNFNNTLTGAALLHAAGTQGQNVIVAVIDSGTALAGDAFGFGGSADPTVIGGESFVPLAYDPVASATSRLNDWHGTAVATVVAAHEVFGFVSTSRLVQSLQLNAPDSVITCPSPTVPGCPAGASAVPMVWMAPAARVYALKVFTSNFNRTLFSWVMAAMDRAITLRRNFNNGMASTPVAGSGSEDSPFKFDSLKIEVVNMSFVAYTLVAGHDLMDQLVLGMLDVGIVPVAGAGNSGFGAMTGGSPGTGIGSLTVGASMTPAHERVFIDIELPWFPVGFGQSYLPSNQIQTAPFSSRGPTADGRFDPDLSASGVGLFTNAFAAIVGGRIRSCGAPGVPTTGPNACRSRILFVDGTSFSTPVVAGAAALLRQAAPTTSARQTRNALVLGANATLVGDGSGPIDQGAGFVDVPAALALLEAGHVEGELPSTRRPHDRDDEPDEVGAGGQSMIGNLRGLGIRPVQFRGDRFTTEVQRLKPGQVAHFFVPSDIFTDRLVVSVTNIVREEPQNEIFGDDLILVGLDAPTSLAWHRIGDEGVFVIADSTFTIDNPQTGLVRIALQGDWTNASRISARLTIERRRRLPTLPSAIGLVKQDDLLRYYVDVPSATQAVFELFWMQNWGRYPTNDLDLLVYDPAGQPVLAGATLASPERVVVANPSAGRWTLVVNGFELHQHNRPGGGVDKDLFVLTAAADGRRLKIAK